jgi:AraC-like DNA-binding protein
MFFLGGVGLAFFLTLLLLSKKNKTIADYLLAGWLFFITLHLLLFYFWHAELYPGLLGMAFPLPLVHGPFLYLYTIALTRGRMKTISLLHFLPAIAVLIYMIPFLSLPAEQKLEVFRNRGAGHEVFNMVRSIANISSGILYIILSSIALYKHRKAIVQEFSSTEKINLQWLQYLTYWLGAIWVCVILGQEEAIFVTVVLFILFIGYFGIRQASIFHSSGSDPDNEPKNDATEDTSGKPKYQKSGLSNESSESLHRNLLQIMSDQKFFRESELSLTDLAKRLNTQPNYLSQVINEREGKNFYDFINTMRVEEFMRLASSPESRKYTLLGLAQECGFNSKSSFNRYFKKVTGKSPSEFLQSAMSTLN